jgi:hypothetical protein
MFSPSSSPASASPPSTPASPAPTVTQNPKTVLLSSTTSNSDATSHPTTASIPSTAPSPSTTSSSDATSRLVTTSCPPVVPSSSSSPKNLSSPLGLSASPAPTVVPATPVDANSVQMLLSGPAPSTPTVGTLLASAPDLDLESARVLVPLVKAYKSWAGLALHLAMLEDSAASTSRLEVELDQVRSSSASTLSRLTAMGDSIRDERNRLELDNRQLRTKNANLQRELDDHVVALSQLRHSVDAAAQDVDLLTRSKHLIEELELELVGLRQELRSAQREQVKWRRKYEQAVETTSSSIRSTSASSGSASAVRDDLLRRLAPSATESPTKRPRLESNPHPELLPDDNRPVEKLSASPVVSTEPVVDESSTTRSTGDESLAPPVAPVAAIVNLVASDAEYTPRSPSAIRDVSVATEREGKVEIFPPFHIQAQGPYTGIDAEREARIRVWDTSKEITSLVAAAGIDTSSYVFGEYSMLGIRSHTGSLAAALRATKRAQDDRLFSNPTATWFVTDTVPRVKPDPAAASRLNQSQFLRLNAARPWNKMLLRLPHHSRTVDYSRLNANQQDWVKRFFELMWEYRREWWERTHWLPLSPLHDNSKVLLDAGKLSVSERPLHSFWVRIYQSRKTRQSAFIGKIKSLFVELQRDLASHLPRCICFDPCFPVIDISHSVTVWNPLSSDLLEDLVRLEQVEPERCHWVDYPGNHPFYRYHLPMWYRSVYAIPLEVYPSVWRKGLQSLVLSCLSPLAVAVASPEVTQLNYLGGLALVAKVRRDRTGTNVSVALPDLEDTDALICADTWAGLRRVRSGT